MWFANYTSGGVHQIQVGDTLTGATSTKTIKVTSITLVSGTWAGGNAAGTLYGNTKSGNFTNGENLNEGVNLNVATLTRDFTLVGRGISRMGQSTILE